MFKMREVKSVKVDNWGVFFLQKLQNFFNKTDYCDLTLQFNDNSQLKVHRLVLSACTDYFNVLEQTCEVIDDILIMPHGLQADVIVPIVNFMYTGTLEFEIDMYGRLLKTARDMNMTVLLKLLEAHKRTVDTSRSQQMRRVPKSFPNRRPAPAPQIRVDRTYTSTNQATNYEPPRTVPVSAHQLRTLQIKPIAPSTSFYNPVVAEPASLVAKYAHSKTTMKGPSRFECNDETTLPPDSFEQFDSISYESKPLITANQASKDDIEDYDNLIPAHDTSSTFEQLRKSYTGNKRPTSSMSSFESPPEKKPNIQDVKEYAEQQRMRKQITAEYDDDNEYDEVIDDEFHNDDDDEDYVPPGQKTNRKPGPSAVVIKQEKDQKPTIVVKDTVGSNVNHAKIISEVLKKYPHLVKNNKNIKLKIMAKSSSSNQAQSIIIKQEPEPERPISIQTQTPQRSLIKPVTTQKPLPPPKQQQVQHIQPQRAPPAQTPVAVQTVAQRPQQQPAPTPPVTQNVATSTKIQTQKVPVATNPAPRRIDSKTMHALIALGAENTTGPWLCLKCGVNGRPISIPSYRGFRRHLINTHKERVDPRICEHCGWRSGNDTELYHHMRVQHNVPPPPGYDFPQCPFCPSICLNKEGFDEHLKEIHPDKVVYQQHCMYCDAFFKDEDDLYNHMSSQHKAQAQKDGLIDYSDDEETEYYSGEQVTDKGIKILSNITIPSQAPIESATGKIGSETLSNVATGIAASLGLIDSSDNEIQFLQGSPYVNMSQTKQVQEPKFVNADGQIMDLTPEQRDEIISQLEGQPEGGVVMVLNDSFPTGAVEGGSDADVKMELEESTSLHGSFEEGKGAEMEEKVAEEQLDWQNESQSSTGQAESQSKENTDEVEQPEEDPLKQCEDMNQLDQNVEDETDQESTKQTEKPEEEEDEQVKIEKAKEKLKLLAGDWSDDEEEEVNNESANDTKETIETPDTSKEIETKPKSVDGENEEIIYETTTAVKKTDEDPLAKTLISTTGDDEIAEEEKEKSTNDSKEKEKEEIEAADKSSTEIEINAIVEDEENDKDQTNESTTKDESNLESEKVEPDTSVTDSGEKADEAKSSTEEVDAKSATKEKKDGNGGDQIRTLISEWGDDEEEDL